MERMTKQRLEEYKSNKAEIVELQYKLAHIGEGDSLIGNDVIMDYRDGYPKPQSVVGYDYGKEERLRQIYEKRIKKISEECEDVELWIEGIQDGVTRRIFRMYYVDGMAQKQIGRVVHLDKSRISRKIDDFLKNAPKATNATL